jgi:hypothetical protein
VAGGGGGVAQFAANLDGALAGGCASVNLKTGEYDPAVTAQAQAPSRRVGVDNSNSVAGVTDPVGHLTTETAYWDGAAYTIQQKAFNVLGESTGETITIPSATVGSVLGKSYAFTYTYTTSAGGQSIACS